jgi:hypothetical protein
MSGPCEHKNEVPSICPCPNNCDCRSNECSNRLAGLRVAFCGASGTGKTTMAQTLSNLRGIPFNPVGSRSVSKEMGFETPYDVDKAGKRAEFQKRLVISKTKWEKERDGFVTDRTTLDNIAYTMLHDIYAVDADLIRQAVSGLSRYTHVIYCPVSVFCNPAGDTNRVQDLTYHELYDVLVQGLVTRYLPREVEFITLSISDNDQRQKWVRDTFG